MSEGEKPLAGRCACGLVSYRLKSGPLFVHCCHCLWCQRETGSAFALNAMIERDRVVIEAGTPEIVVTPSNSGKGQKVARCAVEPLCRRRRSRGVRARRHVGRAASRSARHPHLHVVEAALGGYSRRIPAVPEYYDLRQYWPEESRERRRALRR